MEENKVTVNYCRGCSYFNVYYTKGYFQFNKADCGFCMKSRQIVKKNDNCESWYRAYREGHNRMYTRKMLEEILVKLAAISQILQEEQRNDNAEN